MGAPVDRAVDKAGKVDTGDRGETVDRAGRVQLRRGKRVDAGDGRRGRANPAWAAFQHVRRDDGSSSALGPGRHDVKPPLDSIACVENFSISYSCGAIIRTDLHGRCAVSGNEDLTRGVSGEIWHSMERIQRELAQIRRQLETVSGSDDEGNLGALVAELRHLRHWLEGRRRNDEAIDRALSGLGEAVLRLTRCLHAGYDPCCAAPAPPYPPYPPFPPYPPYPPFPPYPPPCYSPPCPQPCPPPCPPAPPPAPSSSSSSSSSSSPPSPWGRPTRPPGMP